MSRGACPRQAVGGGDGGDQGRRAGGEPSSGIAFAARPSSARTAIPATRGQDG